MASARGQRMSPSYQARRTTWTRPTRNPYGYKAVVDLGELKVVSNWRQGFRGKGAERYASGELYVGDIKNGDREGTGLYHYSGGDLLITRWRSNEPVGEGVHWNADRSRAMLVRNGVTTGDISQAEAESIARRLRQPAGRRMHASKPISWGLATTHAAHAPSHNAVSGDFTQGDYLMAAKARWKSQQQNQSPGSKAGTPRTGVRV